MPAKRKKILRSEVKRVMANFDPRWVNAASAEISSRLGKFIQALPIGVEHVLAWSSFFPGEVDLSRFIEENLDKYNIYLPRVLEDCSMTFVSITPDWAETTQPGVFGLPEPASESGMLYDTENAARTVVLVPGVAFDRRGNRLGRGKGCYDRFLARTHMSAAYRIGVGFSLQMQPDVPTDSYDIVMNAVCTEEDTFECTAVDAD